MDWYNQLIGLANILLAIILGGLIGFERESARKPAGFRTHMIVGGSAALLITLGSSLINSFQANLPSDILRVDPNRIIEAIILGTSVLGTGTIFRRKDGEGVEGLTTAASILFTAGIGIAVALAQYVLAVGGTVLLLLVNYTLGIIEDRFLDKLIK